MSDTVAKRTREFNKLKKRLRRQVGQAISDYNMIQDGDNDPSLIPKLDGKVLVIKDFTVILKERHEIASAILSQLRDAFDGSIRKAFGTGKDKKYNAKFGVIAAVTNGFIFLAGFSAFGFGTDAALSLSSICILPPH